MKIRKYLCAVFYFKKIKKGETIMEFKNRQATNPGRVTLKNVSTGATTTYDITMADQRSKVA